jgi:NAD(P)-dependent dehydrogenase (short-subunit alcohol dehydrogenase family)
MSNVLVVGGTRGLGFQITTHYARRGFTVYSTARSSSGVPKDDHDIHWIPNVDTSEEKAGETIAQGLKGNKLDIVVYGTILMDISLLLS